MAQYQKIFDKSEIEYITPFLKLWMSFNNWYKQDLENIRTDRNAINEYKSSGQIKNEFLKLLNGKSNEDEKFQDALSYFVKNINECSFQNFDYPTNLFYQNPVKKTIKNNSLVYISSNNKEFYFSSGDESRLFEYTLELIYQIRCKLVHGDFDIEDQFFIDLVESSYRILYPIMNKIFTNKEILNRSREYFDKSYFDELLGRLNDLLTEDLQPIKTIIVIYATSIDFVSVSNDLAIIQDSFYKKITGKTVRELKEEKGAKGSAFELLEDEEKKAFEKISRDILSIAIKKAEDKISMTMKDWKKEFLNFLNN